MKTNILAILAISLINLCSAQNTLKGWVKNTDGNPVYNAHIFLMVKNMNSNAYLIDVKTDKKTDSIGTFQVIYKTNEEPVLYVEATGFERKKVKITTDTISIFLSPNSTSTTQNGKRTEDIPVRGVCGMCKKRIEEAAYSVRGVQSAQWSADKQALKVVYEPSKTDSEAIQKKIADIGHDTPQYKAEKSTYDKLPKCCRYRDGLKIH